MIGPRGEVKCGASLLKASHWRKVRHYVVSAYLERVQQFVPYIHIIV